MTTMPVPNQFDHGLLTGNDCRRQTVSPGVTGSHALLGADLDLSIRYSDETDRPCVIVGSASLGGWFEPTANAIVRLLELQQGWDSYGAAQVDQSLANATLKLLVDVLGDDMPVPSVVPTSAGGIQVEWHIAGIDLEIETLSRHRFAVYFEDARTGEEWDDEIMMGDWSQLNRIVALLAGRVRSESGR